MTGMPGVMSMREAPARSGDSAADDDVSEENHTPEQRTRPITESEIDREESGAENMWKA
jgi:hypothetical protein